jgi:multidrug efflux pump subunit AcrB
MKKAFQFFIENPIWANAIIFLTVLFGGLSFVNMDRAFFPELQPVNITITTAYPGASPTEMEEGITIKIEEALEGIAEIDELSSTSSENISTVKIKAFQGTDMDELLAEVKNSVDGISSFPVGAEKPVVVKQKTTGMSSRAIILALTLPNSDLLSLKRLSDEIEKDLLRTGEVSEIDIQGYPDVEYSIEVKENELLRFGLTFDDIVSGVRINNRDISAGSVKTQKEELLIRANAKSTQVEEIENIIIRSSNEGAFVKLRDVANVKFQFADVPQQSYLENERSVVLTVNRRYGEDLSSIDESIKKYVEEFNDKHEHATLTITFSFFDLLNERIDLLLENGLVGLALVLVTLGLFLNVRLSFWVAAGIPISFLGMFILGSFYGMSINMISLFGMILVVGILVDDGIVIAENVYAHFEQGKSPYQAAIDGTSEVASSVLTSVLTTIIAFSVLLFIDGLEQMREMAFVVMAALGFSLIEAFFVLPAHLSSKTVLKTNVIGKFRGRVTKFIDYMRDKLYGELLNLVLRFRIIGALLPLVFILFVYTLLHFKAINSTFFPAIPFDDFTVEFAYKPGEREQYTKDLLDYCQEKVHEVRDELKEKYNRDVITYTTLNVGYTRNLGESGSHCGNINVSLNVEGLDISSFDIINMVRQKIGPINSTEKFMIGGINRWGKPVNIALSGKDINQLKNATEYLENQLFQMRELKDVQNNSSSGKREIKIELKPKAYILGFNHNEISRQIRQGFYGEEAQRLIVGTDEARVWVRYPESDRISLGQLEEMRIKTANQQEIPLNELVYYSIERGDVSIKHFDGVREIEINANQTNPYASTSEINKIIQDSILTDLKLAYPDVNTSMKGQQKSANRSISSMLTLLVVALLLMTLVISLNFNSLKQGLIILTVIPIGIVSAMLGHGIEGQPVSILSAWGMIALMGILVNDAVVFLDTYNRNLKEGMLVKDAIRSAGLSRFRPIILTSVTTVAGLYPLILEQSFQAQFLVPMAISVAYGVLFGTYFILVFFPALVLYYNDMARLRKWLWKGIKPTAEEVEPALTHLKHLQEIKEQ